MNRGSAAGLHCAPVGIFDSGVGGLSVLVELARQLPRQPLIYVADQANTPYGQRELPEIRALSEGIARFLLDQGAQVVVLACNTASAAALHWLRDQVPGVPFVGMEPAVKPAAARSTTGRVGVIATRATFQGELFAGLVARYARDVTVHTQVCPELVLLVEAGELDGPRVRAAVEKCVAPMLNQGIDELVLGCTHYPFLLPIIRDVVGPGVEVIDPAPAVARQAGRILTERGWDACEVDAPAHRFFTTGDPGRFRVSLHRLIGADAPVGRIVWNVGRLKRDIAGFVPDQMG